MIIALDLGTTALKIALFDKNGLLLGKSTQEYDLITPELDWVEEDVEVYWEAFKTGLGDLRSKTNFNPEEIKALGFSAQGETLILLGKDGQPLSNAIVWLDNRAKKQADILREKFGDEECYKVTGQVSFEACWPASKILWIKQNNQELFKNVDKYLLIEDYFIYRMCGKFVAEGSLLCSTTYWNISTREYWQEMLDFLGINIGQLPEIRESGEVVSTILPSVAAELGLSQNMVVCTGALDQAAGAIGVGNIYEGMISENIGAALAICVPVSKPTFDPKRLMPLHYFPLPNMYMIHTFTNGGMTLRWFRDQFCQLEMSTAKLTDEDAYSFLDHEASLAPAGSDGLIMLPHLAGSLAPDVKSTARGVYYGFSLMHKKHHFVRAIMESIAYIVRRNIDALSNLGINVNELRSLGGGSRSSVWNQIKADVLGKKILTTHSVEAACMGAAILAGNATGVFSSVEDAVEKMVRVKDEYLPKNDNKKIYEKGYRAYKELFNSLSKMFDKY